jgi:hypothetical protein
MEPSASVAVAVIVMLPAVLVHPVYQPPTAASRMM